MKRARRSEHEMAKRTRIVRNAALRSKMANFSKTVQAQANSQVKGREHAQV